MILKRLVIATNHLTNSKERIARTVKIYTTQNTTSINLLKSKREWRIEWPEKLKTKTVKAIGILQRRGARCNYETMITKMRSHSIPPLSAQQCHVNPRKTLLERKAKMLNKKTNSQNRVWISILHRLSLRKTLFRKWMHLNMQTLLKKVNLNALTSLEHKAPNHWKIWIKSMKKMQRLRMGHYSDLITNIQSSMTSLSRRSTNSSKTNTECQEILKPAVTIRHNKILAARIIIIIITRMMGIIKIIRNKSINKIINNSSIIIPLATITTITLPNNPSSLTLIPRSLDPCNSTNKITIRVCSLPTRQIIRWIINLVMRTVIHPILLLKTSSIIRIKNLHMAKWIPRINSFQNNIIIKVNNKLLIKMLLHQTITSSMIAIRRMHLSGSQTCKIRHRFSQQIHIINMVRIIKAAVVKDRIVHTATTITVWATIRAIKIISRLSSTSRVNNHKIISSQMVSISSRHLLLRAKILTINQLNLRFHHGNSIHQMQRLSFHQWAIQICSNHLLLCNSNMWIFNQTMDREWLDNIKQILGRCRIILVIWCHKSISKQIMLAILQHSIQCSRKTQELCHFSQIKWICKVRMIINLNNSINGKSHLCRFQTSNQIIITCESKTRERFFSRNDQIAFMNILRRH